MSLVPFRLVRAIGGSLEIVQASVGGAVFQFSDSDDAGLFRSAHASSGPFPGTCVMLRMVSAAQALLQVVFGLVGARNARAANAVLWCWRPSNVFSNLGSQL